VAWLSATTFAPGMMAPDWSLTSPLIDPLPAWAKADAEKAVNTKTRKAIESAKLDRARGQIIMNPRSSNANIQTFESLDK
jgi:hypothetical protein